MTTYQVIQALWDGQRWHHPGQPYPPEGVEVAPELLKRYHGQFIATPEEIAAQANPEAHGARSELQVARARVAELEAQLAAQSTDAEVGALLAAFADEDGNPATPQQALESVQTLRLDAARADQYAKLVAVEGGTDLAFNFVARGKFAALGLTTYESLRGKTAKQLDAVEGVTPEQAAQAVKLVDAHFTKTE